MSPETVAAQHPLGLVLARCPPSLGAQGLLGGGQEPHLDHTGWSGLPQRKPWDHSGPGQEPYQPGLEPLSGSRASVSSVSEPSPSSVTGDPIQRPGHLSPRRP